ncbi:MAG: hypothetical protein HY735_26515 [Verrucomicrobia bacterium]|nr:hypothetical protein [Verrucomicrobiota bacterium]
MREEDKASSALFWREFLGEDGIARIDAESGSEFVPAELASATMLSEVGGHAVS